MTRPLSLLSWVQSARPVVRALVKLHDDPQRLTAALMAYAKWSKRLRGSLPLALPIVYGVLIAFSGPAWVFLAALALVVHFSWPRILGCRPLSNHGRQQLEGLIEKSLSAGLIEHKQWVYFIESASEDVLHVSCLLLSEEGRSQAQATLLHKSAPPATSCETPTRRL